MGFSNNSSAVLDLDAQIKSKQRELDQLADKLKSYNEMNDVIIATISENEKKAADCKKILDDIIAKKETAEKDFGALLSDQKAQIKAVRSELSELNNSISSLRGEKEELQVTNNKLVEDNNNLNASSAKLSDQIFNTNATYIDSKAKVKGELSNINASIVDNKKYLKSLDDEVGNKKAELDGLQERVDSLRDSESVLLKTKEEITLLLSTKNGLEKECAELVKDRDIRLKELSDKEKAIDDKNLKAKDELDLLFGDLSIREKKIEDVKKYLSVIIPKLAAIDSKALFKIDLSKI